MIANTYCTAILLVLWFVVLWTSLLWAFRKYYRFYFDAQDFFRNSKEEVRSRLPVSAASSTFAPHLRSYIDVMKLLVTVSAASIAFGASQAPRSGGIFIAKIVLAFSILYGIVFTALLQFFYEQYSYNVNYYSRWRYSLIIALGFSSLTCFVLGYIIWAFSLG